MLAGGMLVIMFAGGVVEHDYLENAGLLASERFSAKLGLKERERQQLLLGGPPTDFVAPTMLTSFDVRRDMLTGSLKKPNLATCP
jgi:hypothetical protein